MSARLMPAPTGSGKTTIFDLAFLRMLHAEAPALEYETRTTYAIYLAPTKVSDISTGSTYI
jgi:replicative superfamily II helicase